jgi:DNA-binding NarL/FixJ family response regulator
MRWPDAELAQAAAVSEAIANAADGVQVVLLDLKLQGSSGLEGIAHVRKRWPEAAVVMLSSQDAPETQRLAIARGATAFVSKADTAERIIDVIGWAISEARADAKFTRPEGKEAPRAIATRQLTPRQREVLTLLSQGQSNKLIARHLDLSDNTVRRHLQDIFEVFDVNTRAEALIAARQYGLVD